MNIINCIVLCAGEAVRWKGHMGVPKHLLEIDGETLISRTTRLIHKYKGDNKVNVYIVVKDIADKRYHLPKAETVLAKLKPINKDSDKFLSSKHLWNKEGRTLVMFGDIWFSEEAMQTIMTHKGKDWVFFGGKVEGFVQSFYPKDIESHRNALYKLRDMMCSNEVEDGIAGWKHYRLMNNYPIYEHKLDDNFILIDDLTDDFDYPEFLDVWLVRYNASKGE